ncbi:ankyrin repeat-containing protein [Elysia marginata]|uniref:Ankyrin repeat-containing protein n=1 Tax=Elysia marginata TaxID=1093978 RepID=A0AAV4FRH6_9GAST|nr:ankyrin repeat-containing protein [Elysia marginata]
MFYREFVKALREQDISQLKRLLATKKSKRLANGDRHILRLIDLPIIECIRSGCQTLDPENDYRKCEILKLLVHHGADVNTRKRKPYGETAVLVAAEWGYLRCLHVLVESGADLSLTCCREETALTSAAREGRGECVEFLLQHMPGTLLNHKNSAGRTGLMLAVLAQDREQSFLCVQHLVRAGADLELTDGKGNSALLLALQQGRDETVALLLEKGALVNTLNSDGLTPLAMIAPTGRARLLNKLLSCGMDPTLFCRNREFLHIAVSQGQNAVVRGLVLNGFPPSDLDRFKRRGIYIRSHIVHQLPPISPLAVAILATRPSCARYLIANSFFTRYDLVQLPWEEAIRARLWARSLDEDRLDHLKARQCLDILDFLSSRPRSLQQLCLTAISSTLSYEFGLEDRVTHTTTQDRETWMCSPSFRVKVDILEIPTTLKQALLHRTPSSKICSSYWENIVLGEERQFPDCSCECCKDV